MYWSWRLDFRFTLFAAAGIGKIGIVDNDHIEKSTKGKLLWTNSIGNLKIDSARENQKIEPQY